MGGDPAATDLARVLRLPGSENFKYDPPRAVEYLKDTDETFELTVFYDLVKKCLAESTDAASPAKSYATPAYQEGERNHKMFSFCRMLMAKGLSVTETLAAAEQANTERCQPPLEDDEVRMIVQNAANYGGGSEPDDTPIKLALGVKGSERA